jgi:hypothetical protein
MIKIQRNKNIKLILQNLNDRPLLSSLIKNITIIRYLRYIHKQITKKFRFLNSNLLINEKNKVFYLKLSNMPIRDISDRYIAISKISMIGKLIYQRYLRFSNISFRDIFDRAIY